MPSESRKESDGNPAALLSFIFGILFCVPLVTSLTAVVLGIVGMRKSRHPLAGGRSLAVGGLALGLAGVTIWVAGAGFVVERWIGSAPQREVAGAFIRALSVSDLAGANAYCEPAVGDKRIRIWNARMGHMGALKAVQFRGIFYDASGADAEWTLTGRALYTRGFVPFSVVVVKNEGGWKVRRMILKGGTPA